MKEDGADQDSQFVTHPLYWITHLLSVSDPLSCTQATSIPKDGKHSMDEAALLQARLPATTILPSTIDKASAIWGMSRYPSQLLMARALELSNRPKHLSNKFHISASKSA